MHTIIQLFYPICVREKRREIQVLSLLRMWHTIPKSCAHSFFPALPHSPVSLKVPQMYTVQSTMLFQSFVTTSTGQSTWALLACLGQNIDMYVKGKRFPPLSRLILHLQFLNRQQPQYTQPWQIGWCHSSCGIISWNHHVVTAQDRSSNAPFVYSDASFHSFWSRFAGS